MNFGKRVPYLYYRVAFPCETKKQLLVFLTRSFLFEQGSENTKQTKITEQTKHFPGLFRLFRYFRLFRILLLSFGLRLRPRCDPRGSSGLQADVVSENERPIRRRFRLKTGLRTFLLCFFQFMNAIEF